MAVLMDHLMAQQTRLDVESFLLRSKAKMKLQFILQEMV